MSKIVDQAYLLADQYKNAANLDARVRATAAPLRERRVELQHFIERELAQHGTIHITKESGMFIGEKMSGQL